MYDKAELCEKIRELYPDIGECSLDLDVEFDDNEKSWVVHLKKGDFKLKHFLPDTDADACMLGKQCVGLGIEIAQFRQTLERA